MTNRRRAVKPTRRKILTPEEIIKLREHNERRQQKENQIRLAAFKEAVLLRQEPDGIET